MPYPNLHELITHSQSSRAFFLSLPRAAQCALHGYGEHVHSAAELHAAARAVQSVAHVARLGGWDATE